MPPPPADKSLGRGTGKYGRPTVTDLIKAREAEADLRASEDALRKELAEERKRFEDLCRDENLRTMKIVADKDLEFIQQVEPCGKQLTRLRPQAPWLTWVASHSR